jgi:regulator of RNase E activity RraB
LETEFQFRPLEEDERFGVEFSFVSELDIGRIDALTTHFLRLASKKGGEYDGWGCPVTK